MDKNHFKVYTLFSTIEYENGILTGEFHTDLLKFFIELKERFTKVSLKQYMRLPSVYSQQLFSFLLSWRDQDCVSVSVDELHELLNTPESFRKNFAEFKRRVLDKAHKDITEKTSLRYRWKSIRKGRSMMVILFLFEEDKPKPKKLKLKTEDTKLFDDALLCLKEHGADCGGADYKGGIQMVLCRFCKKNRINLIDYGL